MTSRLLFLTRQFRKLSLYFAVPAIAAISPLIVIPAVSAEYGRPGWSALAIAMSLGGGLAIVAELGWGVIGPQRIARDLEGALQTYQKSLASKVWAIGVLAPAALVITFFLVPTHAYSAGLIAFALVVGVVTPSWFFIGQGRPLMVLGIETVPKVIAASLSAVAISQGAPIATYGAGLLLAAAIGLAAASAIGHLPIRPKNGSMRETWRTFKDQRVIIAGRGISALYTALPSAMLGLVNPSAVALFSAADRPMRMGLAVLTGVPNRLQSWVGTPIASEVGRRTRISIWINAGLGLAAALAYVAVAPFAIKFLFAGVVNVRFSVIILAGILAALICASRGLGLGLVAVERPNAITTAIVLSSIVGTSCLLSLGYLFGATGALCALIAAEATGVVAQAILLRRTPRRHRAITR